MGKKPKQIISVCLSLLMVSGILLNGVTARAAQTEQHTHTDDCYAKAGDLLCELPESEGHTHDEDCYEAVEELICELAETEGHTHGEDCYAKGGEPICGLEETEALSDESDDHVFEVSTEEEFSAAMTASATRNTVLNAPFL